MQTALQQMHVNVGRGQNGLRRKCYKFVIVSAHILRNGLLASYKRDIHYNLPLKGSRLLLAVGVVHTPLRSKELPSMVFILQNVSALLHVDRAGMSESRQLRSLGFSLCQNKTDTSLTVMII